MSAPVLSIRPAASSEMALILAFVRELAEYERLEREVVASEADLAAALGGEHPCAEVLFACLDGAPVGYALFFRSFSTFLGKPGLYLEDLFVRPAARGQGVGRALLTHLARLALARGWPRLDWAVLDWNAPSIEFYRRLGARPLADWNLYRLSGAALEKLGAG